MALLDAVPLKWTSSRFRTTHGRAADAKKETGNYPMPDEGHAISAKRLSRMQRKEGNLTKDEFDRINRKADKILRAKSED